MRDIEVFLDTELFERSGNPRIHVVPRLLVRLRSGKPEVDSRNAIGFSLVALR
jgi:hypothetical protein